MNPRSLLTDAGSSCVPVCSMSAVPSAARFMSVYQQYKQAESVTRKRIYLETMEKILEGTSKVIMDSKSGVVPYLPLPQLKPATGAQEKGAQ